MPPATNSFLSFSSQPNFSEAQATIAISAFIPIRQSVTFKNQILSPTNLPNLTSRALVCELGVLLTSNR